MPRSMLNFEKAFAAYGIEVVPYACEYRTPKEYRPSEHDWLPDIRYFNQSAVAWNEYLGMLELWMFKELLCCTSLQTFFSVTIRY